MVAINDSGGVKQASHLVKYDSILGTFDAEVKIVDDNHISIDGKSIEIVSSRDPLQLPWKKLGVQLVIEGTGVFIDTPGASKHLEAGAEKVLITAPAKGDDIPTIVVGVNDNEFDPKSTIVSNASCTTNCLAPLAKVCTLCSLSFTAAACSHHRTGTPPLPPPPPPPPPLPPPPLSHPPTACAASRLPPPPLLANSPTLG